MAAERDALSAGGYSRLAGDADAALTAATPIVERRELEAQARVILSSFPTASCARARETLAAERFEPPVPALAPRRILQDGERMRF